MYTGQQRVTAFVIVGVMLVIAADYDTTAPLAVGFAYLILLTAVYYVGPVALGRLQEMIGAGAPKLDPNTMPNGGIAIGGPNAPTGANNA